MTTTTLLPRAVSPRAKGGSYSPAWPLPSRAGVDAPPGPFFEKPIDRQPRREDMAWLARVREGDDAAAHALVRRVYPTILNSVRCHRPRRTSEEDLVQAVFVKIFNKLGQFSGLVPLEHWVSRITINTCLNQLRHETLRPELRMGDLSEEEAAVVQRHPCGHDPWAGERSKAARELLERLLVRLKPDERRVITLLHLEERSVEDISRLTGWSVSVVKVKAFRARQKMRRIWKTLLKGQRP